MEQFDIWLLTEIVCDGSKAFGGSVELKGRTLAVISLLCRRGADVSEMRLVCDVQCYRRTREWSMD